MDPDPTEFSTLWNDLLALGENLVKQPDSLSLCNHLAAYIKGKLDCEAQLWLAEPFYPLPGEPLVKTIPTDTAPAIVEKCYKTRELVKTRKNRDPGGIVDGGRLRAGGCRQYLRLHAF